jgi:DNA-directed RNA polymerase specialized sigma24 family protein
MRPFFVENDEAKSTNRLLRVIVALLLRGKSEETRSLKEQIGILHDLGLSPSEIAQTLGRSSGYINKELSVLRKSRKSEA